MSNAADPGRWERVAWPMLMLAALTSLWQLLVAWSATTIFPSPVDVRDGIAELVRRGVLWAYIGDSLRRVTIGFLLAVVIGIPFGLALGWYPVLGQAVSPTLQMLRPISPIAWIPVAIVWFGIGDIAAIYLIFLGAFFPLVVASMTAVRRVPSTFTRAGRNFGLTSRHILGLVILPYVLPQLIVGLRLGLGVAWLVVVAAEMIAVDSGLGYLVIDARNSGKRYDLVVAAMLMIGGIGLVLDLACRRLACARLFRWEGT